MILFACSFFCCGAVSGCDEDVQSVLVEGLNSASNTFAVTLINAAFQTVTPETEDGDGGGTGGTTTPSVAIYDATEAVG
jgi:hypothetical protein